MTEMFQDTHPLLDLELYSTRVGQINLSGCQAVAGHDRIAPCCKHTHKKRSAPVLRVAVRVAVVCRKRAYVCQRDMPASYTKIRALVTVEITVTVDAPAKSHP